MELVYSLNYSFSKRKSSEKDFTALSDLMYADRTFLLKYFLVFIFSVACLLSAHSQTGYIYVHQKMINEENSTDFSFTLKNSGGTTISTFSLNDQAASDNVALSGNIFDIYDLGLSHGSGGGDGQLWVIAGTTVRNPTPPTGTSGTVYYRNPGSTNWISTGISGAKYIDGAYANQFVYINSSDNVVFYNNGATNTIYSGGDARDVTANGGTIAISTSSHVIRVYSNTYTNLTAPITGGTWSTINVGASVNLRIDMNIAGNTIVFVPINSNVVQTVPTTGGSTTSLGSVGTGVANNPDIAYDDNNHIYVTAYDNIFFQSIVYSYYSSVWNAEIETRDMAELTAGAANMAYGSIYQGSMPQEIFSRQVDNTGTVHWIDDERVKSNSALNGNAIVIPVAPGTYTLVETLPNNTYDLGRYNIYDPSGSTTGSVSTNTVTFVVTAGQIVFAEYVNEKLVPRSISLTSCSSPTYLQTFDASTSSPIYTTTYGSGTYGTPAFEGTAFHYWAAFGAYDGQYSIVKNTTNWWTNTGLTDHTGNSGYFLLVDASFATDEFYRQRLTNLIKGASYTIGFYTADVSPSGSNIRPNINYGFQDTLGNIPVLATTGNITSSAWTYYSYTFTATTGTVDVFLRNANNGGNGNDLAIDDITITLTTSSTPAATATNDCSANGTITISSPIGSSFEYSTNGTTYQSNPTFSSLSPGSYSVFTRYVGTTGCVSSAASVTIAPLACGTIFDDANGLTDNTVNGTGTNPSNGVYANLVSSGTNSVVASVLANSDGTYSLTGNASTSYKIILTKASQTIGATLTVSNLPTGWVSTGEGTASTGDGTADGITSVTFGTSTNVTGANFGIDQLPTSDNKTFNSFNYDYFSDAQSNGNPTISGYQGIPANSTGFTSYYSTLGSMTASDPEDCASASSCNTNSSFYVATIGANTQLYYNGNAVTVGTTISNFNPALLSIYGQKGYSNLSFTYSLVDKASKKSNTNATWSLTTYFILSLQVESFTATAINNQSVMLNWKTSGNQSIDDYEVWKSNDAQSWSYIGKVAGSKNLSTDQSYTFFDNFPFNGKNYYKLKILGDSKSTESNIVVADISSNAVNKILVGPNPASSYLQISNMKDIVQINVYDMNGRLVIAQATNSESSKILNVSSLSAGLYAISFMNKNRNISDRAKFVKIKN
ncbi:MAG TPA: T9SS type A sorting domain-containing protein [Puia sp.]|nr:T9SS type A sorting domain-containing protein [Puia sp.]